MFGLAMVTYVLFYGKHPFVEVEDGLKQVNKLRHISCDWRFVGGSCPE